MQIFEKVLNMRLARKRNLLILVVMAGMMNYQKVTAQRLTLENAIKIAQENSYSAQLARFSFLASYWTYRSFKAELLPAVNLIGDLGNFDHSIVSVRNYEDGQIAYVNNNSLTNNLTLSVDQQISATGGTISLQSYLYRLDQFSYDQTTYNSQPLRINYTQPLRSFNALKWRKKIAPNQFQIAQKNYLSNMQAIAVDVTILFFNVLNTQSIYRQSLSTLADREALLDVAKKRLELGTTTKSEVLQLELSLLNAKVAVNKNKVNLDDCMYQFFSFLRVTHYENSSLVAPDKVPDLCLSTEDVLTKAIENSSHSLEQRNQMLEAERNLAEAKSGRGIQMSLHGELGFTQTSNTFSSAYQRLRDNEIIGLTLSLPIFDWGVHKGKIKMAEAQLEVTRTKMEQAHQDYQQELRKKVMQFNLQPSQCKNAMRAKEIAEERYEIMRKRFETGSISVTELNTAQTELETSKSQYINQLQTFWSDYYSLQQSTLYNWIDQKNLEIDTNKIVTE